MNTPQTSLALSRTRRTTLALSLVVFFAVLCAFGVWDTPYLPQISRAAAPAALPKEDFPQPETLQTEREHVPAESVAIAPPPAPDTAAPLTSPAPGAEALRPQEKMPEAAVEEKNAGQSVAQPAPGPGALSWEPLVARLAADGFDARQMEDLFASLKSPPLPEFMAQKAIELYGRYGKASLNVADDERVKFAPPDYTRIAGGMTVASGRRTMEANKAFYEGLYKRFGVPAPFIVAIMMVETGLGAEVGKQSALLALGSMSVTDSLDEVLPVITGLDTNRNEIQELLKARSDWAYGELKALIEYARAVDKDAATIPGSIYGAIGICQFMPSNIPNFAVSTNKKRPTPDLFVLSDAAASVACYLSAHGWKKALTPSAQIAVLRSYNHSDVYASTVYGVATALISPSTHRGAESARKGGNAVSAARESARASIPSNAKKAKPMGDLPSYQDLLK